MQKSDARTRLESYLQSYVEQIPFEVPIGEALRPLKLSLRRVVKQRSPANKAVMIVHGANSGSMTFLVPEGGLADYLAEHGWDVWLLDWRGSPEVVDPLIKDGASLRGRTVMDEIRLFTLDQAAHDIAHGVRKIREFIGNTPLSVMGHCVGGGITAIAVANGLLRELRVGAVVLTTLGLFFEVPWDGWIKAEDFILERVLANNLPPRAIDPRVREPWPREMEDAYERWPTAWQVEPRTDHRLLNRLSFMVGRPWFPECIDERIDDQVLDKVFGNLHLGLYVHCGQMVRRGYAAPFDDPDIIDRERLPEGSGCRGIHSYLHAKPFRDLKVTLVTAAKNRVWHRDSMDLMYEWLLGEAGRGRFEKHVFPDYGLQEIFWAKNAWNDSYPALEEALRQ
jgi:pimeloyl-ACP methyl ester carboxylesterase